MIKTKDELCNVIKKINKQNIGNQNLIKNNVKRLKDEFNIPTSVSFDILTLKTDPIDETDNVLFAILSVLNDVKITSFFTKTEISTYSKWKFKEEKVNFPIKLIKRKSIAFIRSMFKSI